MKKPLILSAATGLILSTIAVEKAQAVPQWAQKGETIVKCGGIAKKGRNDCGANGHSCAGQAKTSKDPKEWIYLPQGVCSKIAGSVYISKKKVK